MRMSSSSTLADEEENQPANIFWTCSEFTCSPDPELIYYALVEVYSLQRSTNLPRLEIRQRLEIYFCDCKL